MKRRTLDLRPALTFLVSRNAIRMRETDTGLMVARKIETVSEDGVVTEGRWIVVRILEGGKWVDAAVSVHGVGLFELGRYLSIPEDDIYAAIQ